MLSLNRDAILKVQKNKDPFLMIDYATKVVPGETAEGYKLLKKDEWFFKVHWENDPNMPGTLQIEALVQMCALSILTIEGNEGNVVYLVNMNNIKFYKKILPECRLDIFSKILNFSRGIATCSAEGFVDKNIVCKADFKLALTKDIIKL